jgi:GrpB-like predicted nucleotidyltransferase (UPF0157 family)
MPDMGETVVITPYDAQWREMFRRLGSDLRSALGDVALRIDHIGSTSVPGLAAKPIIDVQISVAGFEPVDAYRKPLESLGYVFRATNPDLTKRYFREQPGQRRTHIHVRRAGSWPGQFALLFRDYMRIHQEDAERYAELKYRLAKQYGEDRIGYTEAKSPFIWGVMMKADKWAQGIGWKPGPSDA